MPLKILKRIDNHSIWGLWHISESQEELEGRAKKELTHADLNFLKAVSHETKRQEFICSRLLTKQVLEDCHHAYTGIEKLGRKPYLCDRSFHLSISHAFPYACVLLNKENTCGIDIELSQERLWRIAHRFLKSQELLAVGGNEDRLCQYWCAKEALYKKFGHLNLSFKDCMTLTKKEETKFEGLVQYEFINQPVKLEIVRHKDAWIVLTVD